MQPFESGLDPDRSVPMLPTSTAAFPFYGPRHPTHFLPGAAIPISQLSPPLVSPPARPPISTPPHSSPSLRSPLRPIHSDDHASDRRHTVAFHCGESSAVRVRSQRIASCPVASSAATRFRCFGLCSPRVPAPPSRPLISTRQLSMPSASNAASHAHYPSDQIHAPPMRPFGLSPRALCPSRLLCRRSRRLDAHRTHGSRLLAHHSPVPRLHCRLS